MLAIEKYVTVSYMYILCFDKIYPTFPLLQFLLSVPTLFLPDFMYSFSSTLFFNILSPLNAVYMHGYSNI